MEGRFRKLHFFPFFAIGMAILYYGRFLDNFFTFDDFKYLENMYGSWGNVALGYGSLRLVSNLFWWPLYAIAGFNPFAYNLFALLLFTSNSILLYYLLVRLLPDKITAFLASSFFVASSVGVDAVFWKATNSSLISLFFYLFTLICYVDYRKTGRSKQFVLAFVFYVFAMFSKEEAASLPLIAALIDIIFLGGWQNKRGLLKRITPFCAVIICYIAANAFVFNYLLSGHAEPEKLFRLRPLYSLFGGGTAFFLAPEGYIRLNSWPLYLSISFVVLSFAFRQYRRLLLFGYLWIFFAFLPQSLTGLGQFEPRVIVNSISRYLYITSIGVSVVFAVVLAGLREWIPIRFWYGLTGVVLLLFVSLHYPRVITRGEEWQEYGSAMRDFIMEMKQAMPVFPSPAQIHVVNGPTGRAFIQQSLRAFYGNTQINWVDDPRTAQVSSGEPLFVVYYRMSPDVPVQIVQIR